MLMYVKTGEDQEVYMEENASEVEIKTEKGSLTLCQFFRFYGLRVGWLSKFHPKACM